MPLSYVQDIRFHARNGKVHLIELSDSDESKVESIIEKVCDEIGNVSAIEFVINLDIMHADISKQVLILLKGSKDD